jgi:hypothetical protein
MKYVPLALVMLGLFAALFAYEFHYVERHRRAQASKVAADHAADALTAHGISRHDVYLPVLAHAQWTARDTQAVIAAADGSRDIPRATLAGVTRGLALGHLAYPDRVATLTASDMIEWARVALILVMRGTPAADLASTIEKAVTGYDADLPVYYTAWAYAAGLDRDAARDAWRYAQVNMDQVRRAARERGFDLSVSPSRIAA